LDRDRLTGEPGSGGPGQRRAGRGRPAAYWADRCRIAFFSGSLSESKTMQSTRPASKEDARKYYEKHQIVNFLEQITADLAINQPADPRRYIYDMLARTLGLESSPPAHTEGKVSSLRLFLECQTPSVNTIKEFRRSVPHAGFSDQLLATWSEEAVSSVKDEIDRIILRNTNDPSDKSNVAKDREIKSTVNSERESKTAAKSSILPPSGGTGAADSSNFSELTRPELEHELERLCKLVNTLQIDRAHAMVSQLQSLQSSPQKTRKGSNAIQRKTAGSHTAKPSPQPLAAACVLRIIVVSDMADIEPFSCLDSLVRAHTQPGVTTLLVMAGNFLAPSALSSLDMGKAMIDTMNLVGGSGFQLAVLGNREGFVPVEELAKRIAEFRGAVLATNLPGLETIPPMPKHYIVDVGPPESRRRVGFVGLLTLEEALYENASAPPFGGSLQTAQPLLATFQEARRHLIEKEGCHLVIPITHQVHDGYRF
jgi:hypothetical protein